MHNNKALFHCRQVMVFAKRMIRRFFIYNINGTVSLTGHAIVNFIVHFSVFYGKCILNNTLYSDKIIANKKVYIILIIMKRSVKK